MSDIKVKHLLKSGIKNLSYLTIGNMILIVLSFIGLIFIVNILGNERFGIFKIVMTFIEMFSFLTLNQMHKVIVREGAKDEKKLEKLFRRTLGVKIAASLISIMACITLVLFFPYADDTKLLIGLFSFHLIFLTFNGYFFTAFQVTMKMKYMAYLRILQKIVYLAVGIGLLLTGLGVIALVIATLLSSFIALFLNLQLTRKIVKIKYRRGVIWDKKLMNPTLIFTILLFMGFLTYRIDVIFLSVVTGAGDVGIYGFAQGLIDPGHVLLNNMTIAFFPIIVKGFHMKAVTGRVMMKYSLVLGGLFLLGAIGVSFFTEDIIGIFAPKMVESAPIFNILMFTLTFNFISFPFQSAILATHNEMMLLKVAWIAPVLNLFFNYIFFFEFGLIGIAYATLAVIIIGFGIRVAYFIHIFKKYDIVKW